MKSKAILKDISDRLLVLRQGGIPLPLDKSEDATLNDLIDHFNALANHITNHITHCSADNQAELQALFTQSADPMMTLAPPKWMFTGCNPSALRLFEVRDENEFVKLGPWDLSPELQSDGRPSAEKAPEVIMQAMKTGSHFFEWDHKAITGRVIHCTVLLSRIDIDGESYLQATVRDVSTEKQKERELKVALQDLKISENHLRSVLGSVQHGVWGLNLKGEVTFVNPVAVQLLGFESESELIGKKMHALVHHSHADGSPYLETECRMYDSLLNGTKHRVSEDVLWKKNGIAFPVSYYSAPVMIGDQCAGAVVSFEDLTGTKELENALKLEQAKSIKNSKLASLGEMSAGIAHEINNPLAIIAGSVGLLEKLASQPEKLASKIQAIKSSCERISRIVKGLRKFSRTGDKTDLKNHELSKIVKEVLILTEAKSKRHSTPVSVDYRSNAQILCDEVEIEQVLVNLINNAIDAVKPRSEKWVKVELFDEGASVVLRVTDSGLGIPESVRNKLFEPFFTTKIVGEGTGLGLSISKGILDEHKATISVRVESPHTCFEIRFLRSVDSKCAA